MATTYTITFDAKGGTGAPGSMNFPSGEGVKIPDTTPTRNGYTFKGWDYSSAGETVCLNPGDIISPKTSITLYAVWSSTADGSSFDKAIPISLDTEVNVEMPNGVADLYYKFTPPEDGDYIFESYNNGSMDPQISLYNSSDTNNAIGSNDDIDGSNNRNFKLTQSLTSGTVYYLKIHRYSTAGTFNFSVTKENTYYTIKFDGNGADAGSSVPLDITQKGTSTSVIMGDISSDVPTKTGYIFRGWSSTQEYNKDYRIAYDSVSVGGADSNGVLATTTGSNWTYQDYCNYTGYTGTSTTLTLYAQWESNVTNYTITFNANGGTGAPGSITFSSGSSVRIPSITPTRNGYTFKGWSTSRTATTASYQSGVSYNISGSLDLYAVWEANNYTYNITYKSTSGVFLGSGTITKQFGSTYSISPSKDFTGYYTPSAQNITWDSTSPKTIVFKYAPINYTISYTLNNGTVSPANKTSYTIETANFTLNNPTRTGYTFKGWSGTGLTGQSNKTVTISKGSSGNKSYIANWTINSYQFTLGEAEHVNTKESTESGIKNYEEQITLRATVDTGYSFGQWTSSNTSLIDNQTSANTSFLMPAGNITMTPSVTSNQYKIIYDIETNANFKYTLSNQPSETIYSYTGGSITITSTKPQQRGGYTFVGWCRTSNSTSDILNPGASINQSTSDITLYAVWKKNIEITYDINGGSGSTPIKQSTTIYNKNGATFSLASNTGFSREGYEFDGWSTTLNNSSTKVLSDTIFKESAILHALWEIQYYSLTTKIYTNGVETNESGNSVRVSDIESGSSDGNTYAYGSVVKLIATAVDPYDFESWSQDNFDKGPGDISEDRNISEQKFTITKNTVIRANFATGEISACFYCYDITSGQPVSTTSTVKLWIRSKEATELTYDEKVWEQKSFSTKMTYNVPTHIQVLIENGKEYEFNSGAGINFDYEIPDQLTDILITSNQNFSIPCKKLKKENHIYVNNALKKSGYIKDPYFSENETISSIWIGNKQIMGLSPSEVYPYTEDSLLIDTLYVNNQNDFLDKSYQGYTSIKKIIIPKNITTIGANYLSNCTNLKTVKFLQNSGLTSLGNQAFASDNHLLKIYLPDKLQNIGEGVFQGCMALQKIVLPASVSTIQKKAFYNCSSLQSLKLNHTKITELPDTVFMFCRDLKVIFLPKTLTSIGQGAFDQCHSLEKIIYMGTIEDWNKITISPGNIYLNRATIQCIDGVTHTNLK